MSKIYGYCRISKKTQSITRQVKNIEAVYSDAIILEEAFTGTKVEGRKKWNYLYKRVVPGDTIVFDSVSRMSRDAEIGWELYKELFDRGVNLEFLKEPHINTDTYKESLNGGIAMTGTEVDDILAGVNKYMLRLAEKQIKIAFDQAEKEVKDLQQRTKEGLREAKRKGVKIGIEKGTTLVTKKSVEAKEQIYKLSRNFQGSNKDDEVWKICGISRNTYYKYKRELVEELNIKKDSC